MAESDPLSLAILALVNDDRSHNDRSLDNSLPVSRHVQQVEAVVQHTDSQRTDNRPPNGANTARKTGTANDRRSNRIQFITHAKPGLSRANTRGKHQTSQTSQ